MLEVVKTAFFVTVGVTLGLAILSYGLYLVFYPLAKTGEGGVRLLGAKAAKREAEPTMATNLELGLTLADGGEKVEKTDES